MLALASTVIFASESHETSDHILVSAFCPRNSHTDRSIGRLDCWWLSPAEAFVALGLLEIHDDDFCSFLDMYLFRNGASSSMSFLAILYLKFISYLTKNILLLRYKDQPVNAV
jgi:hypothetical protein